MKNNILLLFYLFCCILLIGYFFNYTILGIDDANIYFVYMKNFANGNGFVYNIGGNKVEGFTSILWTLIGSLIFKFTNHIEICLLVINFILIFFALKIVLNIIQNFCLEKKYINNYSILFLGLLFVIPGFYDWTIFSLLETGLWTFELVLFAYLLIIPYLKNDFSFFKSSIIITILLPFFIITRPESILLGLVFIGIRFIQLILSKTNFKNILAQVLPMFLAYSLSLFLLTKWRLYYFGFPFPNTYYIKMTDGFVNNLEEGFVYFFKYVIRTNPSVIIFIIMSLAWLFYAIKQKQFNAKQKVIGVLITLSAIGISVPFYTGGDHFRMARFYQVFSPIFFLTFIFIVYSLSTKYAILQKINSTKNVLILLFVFSILPINSLYVLAYNNKNTIAIEFHIAKEFREIGNQLNIFFEQTKKPTVAVVTAGGIAYTYKGNVNDVLGLNNIEVAHTIGDRPKNILKSHRAFNKFVFLKQHPDLFLQEFVKDTTNFIPFNKRKNIDAEFGSKVIKHIYNDVDFNKQYTALFIQNKKTKNVLFAYAYNVYIKSIDTSLYKIKLLQ